VTFVDLGENIHSAPSAVVCQDAFDLFLVVQNFKKEIVPANEQGNHLDGINSEIYYADVELLPYCPASEALVL
jgi:hypothetical protein